MSNFNNFKFKLTEKEERRYEFYTKQTIKCIKFLESLDLDLLKSSLNNSKDFIKIQKQLPKNTNPSWIKGAILEILYTKKKIDEKEFDFYTQQG